MACHLFPLVNELMLLLTYLGIIVIVTSLKAFTATVSRLMLGGRGRGEGREKGERGERREREGRETTCIPIDSATPPILLTSVNLLQAYFLSSTGPLKVLG